MVDRCPGSAGKLLSAVLAMLAGTSDCATDSERIDRIRLLDELKSAAAAAQARETAAFAASQRQEQLDVGVPAERASRGIAAQVALARRISPHSAQRYVGWSTILTTELSATFAALVCGATTEWRAMLVARETAWLSREHRALVDREFAGRLESLGDKRVEDETKKAAYRPALYREADTLIGVGDRRGRGQIMADTLVARLTGQATASDVPLEVNLVMTSSSLLDPRSSNAADDGGISGAADSEGAARLDGYGTVPAAWARELVLGAAETTPVWLRRLFRAPTSGELAAMDSRRRTFTGNQRRFITLRDERCRTPWCEAPIRHIDHIRPAEHGGPTQVSNGQGLCVACNHAKQAPGWRQHTLDPITVTTITPTGHHYRSRAPALLGARPMASLLERQLATALTAS